jgi:hypothetical protein
LKVKMSLLSEAEVIYRSPRGAFASEGVKWRRDGNWESVRLHCRSPCEEGALRQP